MVKNLIEATDREEFGNVSVANAKSYNSLITAQQELQIDPTNAELIEKEMKSRQEYHTTHKNYMSFLSQKAKVRWFEEGDENTRVFHHSIKIRRAQNRVNTIKNEHEEWVSNPEEVTNTSIHFYQALLGSSGDTRSVETAIIKRGKILNE